MFSVGQETLGIILLAKSHRPQAAEISPRRRFGPFRPIGRDRTDFEIGSDAAVERRRRRRRRKRRKRRRRCVRWWKSCETFSNSQVFLQWSVPRQRKIFLGKKNCENNGFKFCNFLFLMLSQKIDGLILNEVFRFFVDHCCSFSMSWFYWNKLERKCDSTDAWNDSMTLTASATTSSTTLALWLPQRQLILDNWASDLNLISQTYL